MAGDTSATPVLCEPAQSKCTWTFLKSTFVRKFAGKMTMHTSVASILCEPAQSKCSWTFHDISQAQFCMEVDRKNAGRQSLGHRFVRTCAVETQMDISQEPFCVKIYRELAGHGWRHLVQTPGPNFDRKNPSVRPHCLGSDFTKMSEAKKSGELPTVHLLASFFWLVAGPQHQLSFMPKFFG